MLQDGNPPMASFSASGMRGANKPYDLAQTRPGYMVVVKVRDSRGEMGTANS